MYANNKKDYVFDFDLNPYESFMRNHLKHYGYYTGRNEGYRQSTKALEQWRCNRGYDLSDQDSDTEYENQAVKDDKDSDSRQEEKRTTQLTFKYRAGKMVPGLREPRHLYALSKEGGSQQAPRWPADMEVLPDRVCHLPYVPKEKEDFYKPTGYEKMPQPVPEGEGRVVYYCPPTKESYFLRSRVGGSRSGCPVRAVKIRTEDDTTLIFESRFESGNLMRALKVSDLDYELQLRYDLYTNKHTQWFYFRVQNMRKSLKYRFTITNLMKPGSLYNDGMRPLLYSDIDAQAKGVGWRRCGHDIKYYKNYLKKSEGKVERNLYSLTWTVIFPNDNDVCYFAHCYPYTYSELQDYLLKLSADPICSRFCKQRILCRSLAGNIVHVLTITSPAKNPEDAKMKKAVVLTARVHPGETNASWMMKGFLDFLTSSSGDAKLLRDTFVFKIVPMLNPDGVIVGNYRCSLAGRDLNRNYRSVLRDSFPSVAHTKTMVTKLIEEREVALYCDLHGHSRKQNVFIYGCENKQNPARRLRERVFPVIMGRNATDKFSYDICKFKVQKSKEGTGRVVLWQMGIMNSYTMEATFCGSTLADGGRYHFSTADYEAMGYHFCDTILDYFDPDEAKCDLILAGLEDKLRLQILRHLQRSGSPLPSNGTVDLGQDFSSSMESSTTGSDSSVDDGLPVHLLALAPKLTKRKKLKTRKERDKKRSSSEKDDVKEVQANKKPATPRKDSQKLKYRHMDRSTLHSTGKTITKTGEGMPVFAQERCDGKTLKKTEYLEALTNAYLMSGVLKPSQASDVPSLRYSAGNATLCTSGVPLTNVAGLCPHHEKALAEQYVANQLAGISFCDNWERNSADPQPVDVEPAPAVPQPTMSPYQHRNFNNHLVTMNSLHQQQKPLGDYIRQAAQHATTAARPNTAKKRVGSASIIRNHPSPFDDHSGASTRSHYELIKRGGSNKSVERKGGTLAATSFTSYDRLSSRNFTSQEEFSSTHNIPETGTPDIAVDRTSSQCLASSTTSSLSFETGGQRSRGVTPQANTPPVSSVYARPSAGYQLAGQVLAKADQGMDHLSLRDVPLSPLASPHRASCQSHPQARVHRCPTVATSVADASSFGVRQRTAQSSHHFKKAQDFYSASAVMAVRSATPSDGWEGGGRSVSTGDLYRTGYRIPSFATLRRAGQIAASVTGSAINVNNNSRSVRSRQRGSEVDISAEVEEREDRGSSVTSGNKVDRKRISRSASVIGYHHRNRSEVDAGPEVEASRRGGLFGSALNGDRARQCVEKNDVRYTVKPKKNAVLRYRHSISPERELILIPDVRGDHGTESSRGSGGWTLSTDGAVSRYTPMSPRGRGIHTMSDSMLKYRHAEVEEGSGSKTPSPQPMQGSRSGHTCQSDHVGSVGARPPSSEQVDRVQRLALRLRKSGPVAPPADRSKDDDSGSCYRVTMKEGAETSDPAEGSGGRRDQQNVRPSAMSVQPPTV